MARAAALSVSAAAKTPGMPTTVCAHRAVGLVFENDGIVAGHVEPFAALMPASLKMRLQGDFYFSFSILVTNPWIEQPRLRRAPGPVGAHAGCKSYISNDVFGTPDCRMMLDTFQLRAPCDQEPARWSSCSQHASA